MRCSRLGPQPHAIIGREQQRAQLRAGLDRALDSQGSLVLVSGEAGIGKTTLVNDLIHESRQRDCLVLTGGCYDLTTTPPYGPWIEAIRDYRPTGEQPAVPAWFGDPEKLGKVGGQAALFEATRRFFTSIAEQQPLVNVLEDLHWSDAASLDLLRYLGRRLTDASMLLVVTYRDDEITRRHDLYQLLPLLVRERRAQRVPVTRLDDEAIRELIEHHYDLRDADVERLAEYVGERSEGNPFFAVEILHGLEEEQLLQPTSDGWVLAELVPTPVPPLLRQVLDARLDSLTAETRSALQVAAVISQHVPLDLWQAVTGLADAVLERVIHEAIDARMLVESASGAGFHFRHALLRDALAEALILNRRRALHRQVGDALTETANPDPDEVASHFSQAHDPRATDWLIRAGVRAERRFALSVAAERYERALMILEGEPDAVQLGGLLLFRIGYLLRFSEYRKQSLARLDEAARVATATGNPVLAAYCRANRGLSQALYGGQIAAGLVAMNAAATELDAVPEEEQERFRRDFVALFPNTILDDPRPLAVSWLAQAGRFKEAIVHGERFATRLQLAPEDSLLRQTSYGDAYYGLAIATHALGQPEVACRWLSMARAFYQELGHQFQILWSYVVELSLLLTWHPERVAERRQIVASAMAVAQEISRAMGTEFSPDPYDVPLAVLEGRWNEARDLVVDRPYQVTHFRHRLSAPRYGRYLGLLASGILGREQGEPERAWQMVRLNLANGLATEPGDSQFVFGLMAQRLAVELSLDAGDLKGAHAWLEAHDHWLKSSDAFVGRAEGQLLWARYHWVKGDLDLARQHAERALSIAGEPRQPLALIEIQRLLGEIDTDDGRFDEAAGHLSASLELAETCLAPFEQAQTLLIMAELATGTRDTNEAQRLLREVQAICEPMGAKRVLERADQLQAQLRDRAGDHPTGLTPREIEVLELIGRRRSNREIAAELFISTRTVERHIENLYRKLDIHSRADAIGFGRRHLE